MTEPSILARYRELQEYVGWTTEDERRVQAVSEPVAPRLAAIVDDFYQAIARNETTRRVITGGPAQVERLKGTLTEWLRQLLAGRYDEQYVAQRWRVGRRHVEIGLPQVFTNAALSRVRNGLVRAVQETWRGEPDALRETVRSIDKLLDLDLAIIEEAYQAEYVARQQRVERLATLGQVAGGVAHELRNPLNVMKTSAFYLLHARNPSADKTAEHLRRIERQIELADGVIAALSSFARMPVPSVTSVEIEPLLREILANSPSPPPVEIVLDMPERGLRAAGDTDQLRIVFGNLIRNAMDAMPKGGTLTLTGCAEAGFCEIEVADTGIGIDPSALSQVMEPLYSTKARGLGLGLAIARSIVERHGGTIQVSSQLGAGTRFRVRLALAGEPSPPSPGSAPVSPGP
jgi:signal transduction histidine kinase